jgi:serine/threonine protein kinase
VNWLSDATLAHLCKLDDRPDLAGTRYELAHKIGKGGMGTVYLARDRELDRPVALKVLHAQHAEATTRFVNEARIIARLEHPSIVPVHDCGVLPDGRCYYAMKLVRGQRLDAQGERPMALPERLALFQKICDAVAFAHAHGVIHRDLKPQNIMLGAFGEVLVMDWGIAKIIGAREPVAAPATGSVAPVDTAHGTVIGTPGYMAPEQTRGDVAAIDERADVYSLGAILYFLLAGRGPVHAGEPAALVPPRHFDRSIPRPIQAICAKALAAQRAERYPTAEALGGDIGDYLAGRRVGAYPERAVETVVRLATKYRTALTLILAYVAMRILLMLYPGL